MRAERREVLFGVVGRLLERKAGDGAGRKGEEVMRSNLDGVWLRSSLRAWGRTSCFGARLCLERSWVEPSVDALVG